MGEDCMGWTWYLAVDMQIFLVMPFLAFLYLKNPSLGKLAVAFASLASFAYSFEVSYSKAFIPILDQGEDYQRLYYLRPWTRILPYLWGTYLAFLLIEWKNQEEPKTGVLQSIKKSARFQLFLVFMGFIILLCLILGIAPILLQPKAYPVLLNAGFIATSRWLIVFAVTLIIIPVMVSEGGCLQRFFSLRIWAIIAKTTFAMYLIHGVVILVKVLSTRRGLEFTHFKAFLGAIVSFGLTLVAGTILHLGIEVPFGSLVDIIIKKRS
jgi:peptidoglycan/LPS O-acetylase OafA/YrhL